MWERRLKLFGVWCLCLAGSSRSSCAKPQTELGGRGTRDHYKSNRWGSNDMESHDHTMYYVFFPKSEAGVVMCVNVDPSTEPLNG